MNNDVFYFECHFGFKFAQINNEREVRGKIRETKEIQKEIQLN